MKITIEFATMSQTPPNHDEMKGSNPMHQEPPADVEQIRQEWREVITQRVNGYLNGTIPTVDAAEALARIEEQFEEKFRQ